MKRFLIGGLIAGMILYVIPGARSGPACIAAGLLATWLMLLLGPCSIVEKVGALMLVSLMAWVAGPRAAWHESLLWHLAGWLAASTTLASYLHPRRE